MGILVIALSIKPRPLSALELTLSGLIIGSRVDTVGDNQNPHVIISKYNIYNQTSALKPLGQSKPNFVWRFVEP